MTLHTRVIRRRFKSGRTTGVTRGVVTRVSTITRLDYGNGISEDVGGFEIGPDPDPPAPSNEISKGGDSGSAWLAIGSNGRPRHQRADIVGLTQGRRLLRRRCQSNCTGRAEGEVLPRLPAHRQAIGSVLRIQPSGSAALTA